MKSDRAPHAFIEHDVPRDPGLTAGRDIVLPGFGSGRIPDKDRGKSASIKFVARRGIIVDVALRAENAEVTDVRLFIPERLVRGLAFYGGGRRSILRIDRIVDGLGPE